MVYGTEITAQNKDLLGCVLEYTTQFYCSSINLTLAELLILDPQAEGTNRPAP